MKTRKITALILSMALILAAFTFAGCGHDTRFIMTVNGEEVPVGWFIMNQFAAAREAQALFAEEHTDVDVTVEDFSYEDYQIEGTDYVEWVNDRAIELTARMFIIDEKFTEMELSFDDETRTGMTEGINNSWNTDRKLEELYSMLGEQAFDYATDGETWEDFFTAAGVSKESFTAYHTNEVKMSMVFDGIYGEGGTNPVSDEEWLAVFEKDYIRYRTLPISLADDEGEPLPDDEIAERRELAQSLLEGIVEGKSFTESKAEYDEFIVGISDGEEVDDDFRDFVEGGFGVDDDEDDEGEGDANIDEPDESGESGESESDEDETGEDVDDTSESETESETPEDETESTEDEDEDWRNFNVYEQADKDQFDDFLKISDFEDQDNEIVQFIMDLEIGVPEIYQGENADFIFMRLDVLDESNVDDYKMGVVVELRYEEYEDMLDEGARELLNTVTVNQIAVDKFDPRKFIVM